jgi:predicted transcriptional regulator
VLLVIARDPKARLRDIAAALDITERAAQRIVSELVDDGYLTRKRVGRRNEYKVHPKKPVPTPHAQETEVGELLDLLLSD